MRGAAAGLILLASLALVPAASALSLTVHAGTHPDGSLYFEPRDLRATQGEAISLTVVNDDSDKPHDWQLLSYGGRDIEAYTSASQTKTIAFKATEAGIFRVICGVVGHKQMGMEGRFLVAEKGLIPAPGPALILPIVALLALLVGSATAVSRNRKPQVRPRVAERP